MRQVWIPRIGGPEVLEVREAPDPTPGPGEVRIAVEACGVNFADLMARQGLYPDAPPLPAVVGYEVSGAIDAVGTGVDAARIGEPVVAMCRFGGYSSMLCVPSGQATRRPAGLDARTGAAIPVVYLTAWMMCEVFGRVRAGDRVLIHSAGGGVGLAALDLVKWRGGTAIGTASTGKHAVLRERGFDQLIDYTKVDFAEALKGETGLDLILDPVGGASWAKGLSLLRAGGIIACFGMSSNAVGETRSLLTVVRNLLAVPWLKSNPVALINANKGIVGVNMGHMWHEGERVSGWLAEILALWTQGTIRPLVHAAVPFAEAAEAHAILHRRENLGKVLLIP
jgi:NADPH:quinone reductase-like Zn-dependent oxidoreductase